MAENPRDAVAVGEAQAQAIYEAIRPHGVAWTQLSPGEVERYRRAASAAATLEQHAAPASALSILNEVRMAVVNNRCDGESDYALGIAAANGNMLQRIDHMLEQHGAAAPAPEVDEPAHPTCVECSDQITAHDPGLCGTCYATKHEASNREALPITLRKDEEGIVWLHFSIGNGQAVALSLSYVIAKRLEQNATYTNKVMAEGLRLYPAALASQQAERTPLEQFDLDQSPEYRKGYEDGRLKGFEVGQRYAKEWAAHATQKATPVAEVVQDGATVRLQWSSVSAAHNARPGPLYTAQLAAQPATPMRDFEADGESLAELLYETLTGLPWSRASDPEQYRGSVSVLLREIKDRGMLAAPAPNLEATHQAVLAADPDEPERWCWYHEGDERVQVLDSEEEAHSEAQQWIDDNCEPGEEHEYLVAPMKSGRDLLPSAEHVGNAIFEHISECLSDEMGAEEDPLDLTKEDISKLGELVRQYFRREGTVQWWTVDSKRETKHTGKTSTSSEGGETC